MKKKKGGYKVSGDPRKKLKKVVENPIKVQSLKLKEFIDMNNPRDLNSLRLDAIELKSEDVCDDFLYWYQEKTGVETEVLFQLGFLLLPFFETLLDKGEMNSESGVIDYNSVIEILKADDKPNNIWRDLPEFKYLGYIIDYMSFKKYDVNFHDFKSLDFYKERMLEEKFEFFGDEEVRYSFPQSD